MDMDEHDSTERRGRGRRTARRLAALTVAAGAAVVGPAGSADATGVPAHDHFLTTGNGDVVQVGPRVCTNPDLHDAFHNFHSNIHLGSPRFVGGLTITVVFC